MKYKILHTLPDLHIGGVSNLLLLIIAEFNDDNFEHHICYFGSDETLIRKFQGLNVHIHKIEHSSNLGWFKTLFHFNQFVKIHNFDIIHSHLMLDRYITGICSFFNKIPIVTTVHTTNIPSDHKKIIPALKLKFEDFLGKKTTTKFIAISETVKSIAIKYRKIPENNILTIYSGIKIQPPKSRKLSKEKIKMISVGRFIESKGFLDLIEVVRLLREKNILVNLTLIGQGPMDSILKKKVKELQLDNQVFFTGFIQNVGEYLNQSDIYITATKEEGFSIATVEALSHSLPVITYDIPIFNELSNNGSSFVTVPLSAIDEFVNKLISLLEDEVAYQSFSRNGYLRAKQYFNIQNTVKSYLKLYKEIISKQ